MVLQFYLKSSHRTVIYLLGAGIADPGVRGQIFISMFKNDKGLMDVNENFITVNEIIACDTSWTEEIHHDLKSYIK